VTTSDRLIDEARYFELKAAQIGERLPPDLPIPPVLVRLVQKEALTAVSLALYRIADVIQEQEAA
jgi:hypothetical protein